jgi:sulfite reductase (NADPH) flavoprotein alpha-component
VGSLTGLSYGVLAIGDSAFDLFCESGKEWDMVLEQKGGNRAVERIDCDTDYDDYADEWMAMALDVMKTIE